MTRVLQSGKSLLNNHVRSTTMRKKKTYLRKWSMASLYCYY